jgi:cell wall-associated NlpC family hydrolase
MKGSGSRDTATTPDRVRFRLRGKSASFDRRIHAVRDDLADVSLADIYFSAHYARARPLGCAVPGTPVRASPSLTAETTTQLLRGEIFHALDITTDWVWGFCGHDGYVGYVRRDGLDEQEVPTHRVTAVTAPVFAGPDIKSPVLDHLPIGACLAGSEDGSFALFAEGYVHLRHLARIDQFDRDWVSVGEHYLGLPYVWGGRGHGGIDCSGLVQVALARCGLPVPRDTDLQREGVGQPIAQDAPLRRGDLVFFPGHVGMMADESRLLHANAFWMATVIEPLADVVDRLKPSYEQPVIARRRIG